MNSKPDNDVEANTSVTVQTLDYETKNLKAGWEILSPCFTGVVSVSMLDFRTFFYSYFSWIWFSECDSSTVIDLMFVIDGSLSIGNENFAFMLEWVKNVSNGFDITKPVQIGIVRYLSINYGSLSCHYIEFVVLLGL